MLKGLYTTPFNSITAKKDCQNKGLCVKLGKMITLIVVIILVLVLLIFSIQNASPVPLFFFFWRFEVSLAIVIFLSFICGIIITLFVLLWIKMKKQDTEKDKKAHI